MPRKDTPPLADWEVHTTSGSTVVIAGSWWEKDKHGAYTFHNEHGTVYEFGRSAVEYVHQELEPCAASASTGGYHEAAR